MIVFGGYAGGWVPALNDTWILTNANGAEGPNPSWIRLTPGSPSLPSPRGYHTAVYDQTGKRMVVFGGNIADGTPSNDAWVLQDANGLGIPRWVALSPTGPLPEARASHVAAYDPGTNRMTVFGGAHYIRYDTLNDTWLLTSASGSGGQTPTWTQLFPAGTAPAPRYGMAVGFAISRNRMLIYGGTLDDLCCGTNEVWVLKNATGGILISAVTGPTGPLALGTAAIISANFTDADVQDTHTCTMSWDDGTTSNGTVVEANGSGTCTAVRTYAAPGVYAVSVTVTDNHGASAAKAYEYVVIYDPNGGFVTGGGWIISPAGAYAADPSLSGRASFGFVSKYQKGANVPTGKTEFQFHAASFNFHSSVYDWLVVAGPKAQYKGTGTVNGAGDYGFLLTATDGALPGGGGVDKFRIKVWEKVSGALVYDNVRGASDDTDAADPQAIAGGSIVIHSR